MATARPLHNPFSADDPLLHDVQRYTGLPKSPSIASSSGKRDTSHKRLTSNKRRRRNEHTTPDQEVGEVTGEGRKAHPMDSKSHGVSTRSSMAGEGSGNGSDDEADGEDTELTEQYVHIVGNRAHAVY